MTIIVPTDFSATANNAANYAARMLKGTYGNHLVLYHVYEKAEEEAEAAFAMEALKADLQTENPVSIEVKYEQSTDLIYCLSRLARHMAAGMIVMGITGRSRLEQVFLGSNTLKMVERNACPVLIVPPAAQFTQIENVALTSDYRDVQHTIPVAPIRQVLQLFRPALHVVNVNSEHYVSLTEEYLDKRAWIVEKFADFRPEFYFISTYNVEETIQTFVGDKNIDLIVTVPRHRNIFSGLYRTSTAKKLAYESAVPILLEPTSKEEL